MKWADSLSCCHKTEDKKVFFVSSCVHSGAIRLIVLKPKAKIHFMVLAILKFQNVNWFIRNTDFPANRCWNISNVCRPKTPPTTPRSFIWHINFDGPKWKNYKLFFTCLSISSKIKSIESTGLILTFISLWFHFFRKMADTIHVTRNIERNAGFWALGTFGINVE